MFEISFIVVGVVAAVSVGAFVLLLGTGVLVARVKPENGIALIKKAVLPVIPLSLAALAAIVLFFAYLAFR